MHSAPRKLGREITEIQERDSAGYSVAARISTEMVRFTARYTGRGPTKSRTTLNANLAVAVLEDGLTKAEANLVAAGALESVRQQRRVFHQVMQDEVVATIEQVTGRQVRAYVSDIVPEIGLAVHTFVFDGRPETGKASVAEAASRGDGVTATAGAGD